MTQTIGQRELRNDSGAIMRRVQQGEHFVVTSNGVPVADLRPHQTPARPELRRFVPIADIAERLATLPSWGVVEQFHRERDDIDALLDDDQADPWAPGR